MIKRKLVWWPIVAVGIASGVWMCFDRCFTLVVQVHPHAELRPVATFEEGSRQNTPRVVLEPSSPSVEEEPILEVPTFGLSGIWAEGTSEAKALIVVNKGASRWLQVGETVATGFRLSEIGPDSVKIYHKETHAYYEVELGAE
jgi:hypothetical protein